MPFRRFPSTWLIVSLAWAMAWLSGCGVTLVPPGWVKEHKHSVCKGWFDWNSYRRPSFTIERYDRLPPDSARVKLFRWLHGGSVEEYAVIAPASYSDVSPTQETNNGDSSGPVDSSGKGPVIAPPPLAPPSDKDPVFPNEFIPPETMDEQIIADQKKIAAAPVSSVRLSAVETDEAGVIALDFLPIDEEAGDAATPIGVPQPDCSLPVYYPVLLP